MEGKRMNRSKRWPGRALAIMMCAILMVSSMGLTVFADEQIPGSSDAGFYEETAVTGTGNSAQEDDIFQADESSEDDQDIDGQVNDEAAGDLPAGGTDDDHQTDEETTDEGLQDDPAASDGMQSGDDEPEEGNMQSGDDEPEKGSMQSGGDEIEEDAAQSAENEAVEAAEPEAGEITTWGELADAFERGGEYTLTQDIAAGEGDKRLYIPQDVHVTLNLNGHTLGPGPAGEEEVIFVYEELILNGDGTILANNNTVGVRVDELSNFTMNGGTISGGLNNGVFVGIEGKFTMNGGSISGSIGNGVYIEYDGRFTMNGGTISGCGGSGVYAAPHTFHSSEFIMNGGRIAENAEYGVHQMLSAYIRINGGEISSNTKGGVFGEASEGTIYLSGNPVIQGRRSAALQAASFPPQCNYS